jgi:hypothetical protein
MNDNSELATGVEPGRTQAETEQLRDTFALEAFRGLMRKPTCFDLTHDPELCFRIADLMMAARAKRDQRN